MWLNISPYCKLAQLSDDESCIFDITPGKKVGAGTAVSKQCPVVSVLPELIELLN